MPADRIPDISRMVPQRAAVEWTEALGRITIVQPRKGMFRGSVLRLFGVPPVVRINLDPLGSEVWRAIDGKRTVAQVKEALHGRFPEETDLARRLGQFFSVMVSRGLVTLDAAGS